MIRVLFVLLVIGFCAPANASVPDGNVFSEALDGRRGAYHLDRVLDEFNGRIVVSMGNYYNKKTQIIEFLMPAFVHKPENLEHGYKAMQESKAEMNIVYNGIRNVFEETDVIFERHLQNVREEDREEARKIWEESKRLTAERVKRFFAWDVKFYQTYEKALRFLLDRSGTYFVSQDRISFMGVGDYDYFGSIKDTMKKIQEKQTLALKKQSVDFR